MNQPSVSRIHFEITIDFANSISICLLYSDSITYFDLFTYNVIMTACLRNKKNDNVIISSCDSTFNSVVRGSLHPVFKIRTDSVVRRSLHPLYKFGPIQWSLDTCITLQKFSRFSGSWIPASRLKDPDFKYPTTRWQYKRFLSDFLTILSISDYPLNLQPHLLRIR